MDIQSIKSLMEIQAIQSISGNNSSTNSISEKDSSAFTELIQELINTSSNESKNTSLSNLLGSLEKTELNNSANTYLETLLYEGQANIPTSLYHVLLTNPTTTTTKQEVLSEIGSSSLSTNNYEEIISKASAKYGIPQKLIQAVIKQESNFNPNATSTAGATGLMQLMPSTAKFLGVLDSKNPEQNIMGGTKYLRQMLDKFNNNIELALAAYNAGPGNVKKYNGIPPFKETQNYVNKVLNYYKA